MPPSMINRPRDIPDFGAPPVTEVVLGVQFNSLDRLKAPHLGLVWEVFRDRFGEIEERPPVDPAFETFPEKGAGAAMALAQFQLISGVQTPRVLFMSGKKTELLQVQRDRFMHNWRKVEDADVYPRFEKLLATFLACYGEFDALVKREGLGTIVPNQCEITYVNQILLPPGETPVAAFERIFGNLRVTIDLEDLGKPEDARFMIRYVMRDRNRKPNGRLLITADPGLRADGTNIVRLTLVARGQPVTADTEGISEFLSLGRRLIVRSFTNLTSKRMHEIWERRQ
jgi:uncharacterized protein (TIGR04255 family)